MFSDAGSTPAASTSLRLKRSETRRRPQYSPCGRRHAYFQPFYSLHVMVSDLSIGIPESKPQCCKSWTEQTTIFINEIEDKIAEATGEFEEYHFLLTIPGFGPYISALVLAKIGNPFRVENRKQVLKMSSFNLSAKRSRKGSDKAYPVISKKGSNALRYALFQGAVIASSRNNYFIHYFTNTLKGREKERGIKIKMRVKLAAKLLVIAWTIMKTKKAFDPALLYSVK
jgi:Transposase IS116/IS110/IS902 family